MTIIYYFNNKKNRPSSRVKILYFNLKRFLDKIKQKQNLVNNIRTFLNHYL